MQLLHLGKLFWCGTHTVQHGIIVTCNYNRKLQIDSLVIRQGGNIEGLRGTGAQGERVHLLLGHECSAVGFIDI